MGVVVKVPGGWDVPGSEEGWAGERGAGGEGQCVVPFPGPQGTMAEARQAATFRLDLGQGTPGRRWWNPALKEVGSAGLRSWRRSLAQCKDDILSGACPAGLASGLFLFAAIQGSRFMQLDPSLGLVDWIKASLPDWPWSGSSPAAARHSTHTNAPCPTYPCPLQWAQWPSPACPNVARGAWPQSDPAPLPQVSDWWGEYVYLRSRSPLLGNSNFYILDFLSVAPTPLQAARAGNAVYAMMRFREQLGRGEIEPATLLGMRPLCSAQYRQMFNTTRIPGVSGDRLYHVRDGCSRHVVVLHRGRFFRLGTHGGLGGHLLSPRVLEQQLQYILDDSAPAQPTEEHLAALTAAPRALWAQARASLQAGDRSSKAPLEVVEGAAFFVCLEETPGPSRTSPELDERAQSVLVGTGHSRWLDKSLNLVVFASGHMGLNVEHSWADTPVPSHMWEAILAAECFELGYAADGHCRGTPNPTVGPPERLLWMLPEEVAASIPLALREAQALARDTDCHILPFTHFGRGFTRRCRIPGSSFVQLALQLARFRDQGSFCLTYEACVTRSFHEGRTETVRPCTVEACAFVRAMEDPRLTDAQRLALFQVAAEKHWALCRAALTGEGVDRHLFCLYLVSQLLRLPSPFLTQVRAERWKLSTSQSATHQPQLFDPASHPDYVCCGGGFGPADDDGYGVSYVFMGESMVTFHISCRVSSPDTESYTRAFCPPPLECPQTCPFGSPGLCVLSSQDSRRFGQHIQDAMLDVATLFGLGAGPSTRARPGEAAREASRGPEPQQAPSAPRDLEY
ncbi:palmitoyl thioesterase CPT1C isoform X9 [Phascolarctos cinereus]